MEIQLKIVGTLMVLLALIHVIFPRYFKWQKELASLSLVNKEMMVVHTFFVALTVLGMGIFCFLYSDEMVHNPLGKKIAWAFFIFWMVRLWFQFFGYSKELWKGKKFETAIHLLFIFLWSYFSIVFFIVGMSGS